jgi:hypothetical protein
MLLFGISLILDIRAKLVTVDEHTDDEIVHLHGLCRKFSPEGFLAMLLPT